MELLESVIVRQSPHFVRIFVSQFGFSEERAEQFVSLAASDLIESYKWCSEELNHGALSAPENVRGLLGAIGGNRIADALGIPRTEAWTGLRVFVPRVLQLAERLSPH